MLQKKFLMQEKTEPVNKIWNLDNINIDFNKGSPEEAETQRLPGHSRVPGWTVLGQVIMKVKQATFTH